MSDTSPAPIRSPQARASSHAPDAVRVMIFVDATSISPGRNDPHYEVWFAGQEKSTLMRYEDVLSTFPVAVAMTAEQKVTLYEMALLSLAGNPLTPELGVTLRNLVDSANGK